MLMLHGPHLAGCRRAARELIHGDMTEDLWFIIDQYEGQARTNERLWRWERQRGPTADKQGIRAIERMRRNIQTIEMAFRYDARSTILLALDRALRAIRDEPPTMQALINLRSAFNKVKDGAKIAPDEDSFH